MANTYIRIISLLILSFGFCSLAQAQTCKVNCGVNHEGCLKYKEVYEYDYVTEKPSFPGGETKFVRYINKTREYPKEAYKKSRAAKLPFFIFPSSFRFLPQYTRYFFPAQCGPKFIFLACSRFFMYNDSIRSYNKNYSFT